MDCIIRENGYLVSLEDVEYGTCFKLTGPVRTEVYMVCTPSVATEYKIPVCKIACVNLNSGEIIDFDVSTEVVVLEQTKCAEFSLI